MNNGHHLDDAGGWVAIFLNVRVEVSPTFVVLLFDDFGDVELLPARTEPAEIMGFISQNRFEKKGHEKTTIIIIRLE